LTVLPFTHTGYGAANTTAAAANGTAGVYSGATTYRRFPSPHTSKPSPVFGAVSEDGTGYFISVPAASSEIRVFQNLKGSGSVASPESEVPTEGQGVARGAQAWPIEIKPADSSGHPYTLQGKFNCGDCVIALNLEMQPLTRQQISLASRNGSYAGFDINRLTRVTLTLDSMGRFTGTDTTGCHLSGILTQVGSLNLFAASVTMAGAAACHGAMTGVAFFDPRDRTGQFSGATGSYLYLIGANGDFSHGFAMAVSYQRK
jgi:hypothetical protein